MSKARVDWPRLQELVVAEEETRQDKNCLETASNNAKYMSPGNIA